MTRLIASLLILFAFASHAGPIMYVEAAVGGGGGVAMGSCVTTSGGGGTAVNASTTGLSVSEGDLLVFVLGVNSAATPSEPTILDTTPTGGDGSPATENAWNLLYQFSGEVPTPGHPYVGVWWKQASASEGVDPVYRIDWTNTGSSAGTICKITGHEPNTSGAPTAALDAQATLTGDSDSIDTTSISTSTGALAVFFAFHDGGGDTFVCPASNTDGCNLLNDVDTVDTSVAWRSNTGSTPTISWTSSTTADEWRTVSVSFNDDL